MEGITIGQIAVIIAFMVTMISGIGVLMGNIKKWVQNAMKEPMDSVKKELESVKKQMNEVDLNTSKNFLVARIGDVENGQGMSEIGKERFWEEYEHYTKLGGNSYIKRKVDQLKADGKM